MKLAPGAQNRGYIMIYGLHHLSFMLFLKTFKTEGFLDLEVSEMTGDAGSTGVLLVNSPQ